MHSSWGRPSELRRKREGVGHALFASLPPEAKVRLIGIGVHGEEFGLESAIEASGTRFVAWP